MARAIVVYHDSAEEAVYSFPALDGRRWLPKRSTV